MATLGKYQYIPPEKIIFEGEQVWKVYGTVIPVGRQYHFLEGILNEKEYIFLLDNYDIFNNNQAGIYIILKTSNTQPSLIQARTDGEWNRNRFTLRNFQYMNITYINGEGITYIKNFQIEEGTKATTYEPYYILSNTTVVQPINHTLTAIWEED